MPKSKRINKPERIVQNISVPVQTLRIKTDPSERIGRHPPPKRGTVLSEVEMIQSALAVPFFAGEVHRRRSVEGGGIGADQVVAERQARAASGIGIVVGVAHALRAEPVCVNEEGVAVVVGGEMPAVSVDLVAAVILAVG